MEYSQPKYVSVDIQSFRHAMRDINFDIFIKLSEDNMAHVFSRTTGLDYKRLAQYMQKGVRDLYIRSEDRTAYEAFISRTTESIFEDPNTSKEKKIATLLNMSEQSMSELFAQLNISEDTAENAQRVVKKYVNLLTENPKSLSIILRLASHGDYLYYHSIAVAIFSMFLAKASGQFNQRMIELIGMGGFLHDIGCTQLSKEIVCSPLELSPAQWAEMHLHPKSGLSMIESTPNIPDEVRYIVYQHHEQPNGTGYPNGLKDQAIYYPAKLVAVADAFSALISKRPFRPAYSVEQAVQIMQNETGKYDPQLVKLLGSIFLRQTRAKAA